MHRQAMRLRAMGPPEIPRTPEDMKPLHDIRPALSEETIQAGWVIALILSPGSPEAVHLEWDSQDPTRIGYRSIYADSTLYHEMIHTWVTPTNLRRYGAHPDDWYRQIRVVG